MKLKPRCMQKKTTYTFDYPQVLEYERIQMENFWKPDDPKVEKDLHTLLTDLHYTEYHGVTTVLKLFTLYEVVIGNEYWLGRFRRMFPRPEFERVAAAFGFFELNVHAPFYNKINEMLSLNTDEFYNSYADDPELKARMQFIETHINSKDDLLSLATFSMIEGAVLYAAFAFLKHFQTSGKNKLANLCAGINYSVRDEALHSSFGAQSFQLALNEMLENNTINQDYVNELNLKINDIAKTISEHEKLINRKIFEKGEIPFYKEVDANSFVDSRIDECLVQLGFKPVFNIVNNPIAETFYRDINLPKLHDFFATHGSEYNHDWSEDLFVVKLPNKPSFD